MLSVLDGGGPSVIRFRWSIPRGPLNTATKAQKLSALSPLTECGRMWQLAPRLDIPVTTQVLLSRAAQASFNATLRVTLEDLDPLPLVLDPLLGPGCAIKAFIPWTMMLTNARSSYVGVSGDEIVCTRSWTVPTATKLCAVQSAHTRRDFSLAAMVELATSSSRRVMAAWYGLGKET